ncbi:MAG: histidine phosphatase family protein [Oscillospiraceae bacterium]|nr:histidine phosphatase family protein [Oscillospiraceae bacterium]
MKLLIIRHGDPNYEIDSLTEKGWKEAEMLAERIAPLDIKAYYVSPLGRAKDTASLTLKKAGREAEVLPWAREYNTRILGENGERRIPWDMLPEKWTAVPEYYDKDKWYDVPVMKEAGMEKGLRWVWDGLDELLARHGYKREGMYYRAEKPNEDTIAIFCHFGVECVMLGHLLGISPMALWHGFMAAPTSVTTVNTEERRDGIASFRVSAFGDISHLYVKGEEPAFAGRFCETFANTEQRHD